VTVPYLVLSWSDAATRPAETMSRQLAASQFWRRRLAWTGLEIWTGGARALPVEDRPDLGAAIVGRIFPSQQAELAAHTSRPAGTPDRSARSLVRNCWGEYVALFRDGASGALSALRDPSGALDALTWRRDDVALLASDIDRLPPGLRPRDLRLNWDVIADTVRRPFLSTTVSPLDGLHTIAPGDLHPLGARPADATPLWRPAHWARATHVAGPEDEIALKATVDAAVTEMVSAYPRCLLEVSGGLDSAIVATTALRTGAIGHVAAPLHLYDHRPEGDERVWADQVMARLARPPMIVPLQTLAFDGDPYAHYARGARPGFNAVDPVRGAGTRQALADARAEAVVSGKGGDATFYETQTALVLADYLRLGGLGRMFDPTAQAIARWLRRSIWSVLGEVRRGLRDGPAPRPPSPLWGPRAVADGQTVHPWLTGLDAAPPGKRFQIETLAVLQIRRGDNAFAREADLLHPLMSQPVLEAFLPIASWDLVRGRGRGLARTLFADRVPAAVVERRSKGGLNTYFARMVAANLDFLRPHLIDGCLADAGVLDRGALDVLLRADTLIWRGDPVEVLNAAIVESWVRYWQGQAPDSLTAPRTPL
jgi:asparagine synthase (glutamine-hydrolysing)